MLGIVIRTHIYSHKFETLFFSGFREINPHFVQPGTNESGFRVNPAN